MLTAYRGILNREPDRGGYAYWVNFLDNGNSMSALVTELTAALDNGEIGSATVCRSLGYGWGTAPVPGNDVIPVASPGIATLPALQAALANAAPGSTVWLAQRAVIFADSQVVVPSGVTLATYGVPPRTHYAKQARIVRTALFPASNELEGGLIKLMPGARLDSVWSTGQRQTLGYTNLAMKVVMAGGFDSAVVNSRSENSNGWVTVLAHRYGNSCGNLTVQNNLLTGYANTHRAGDPGYTDGISGNCEAYTATGNDIIDASDVGIIMFSPDLTTPQRSVTTNNIVVAAGVPAFAAYAMDALSHSTFVSRTPLSFDGASISNNQFWSAPDTHFDFSLAIGTWPWSDAENSGSKGRFVGNSNMGIATPMNVGIVIDGMVEATVQGNALNRVAPRTSFSDNGTVFQFACAPGDIVADANTSDPHASGTEMQGPFVNRAVHACVRHW